ncbi:TonB-dependent receptor [Novimethylophilus kurashikiensis]|uniref:TonB-dependent receptor n=2 Tax=Novimethylophilus kurashikiensis TaxID=1825523 RepID=A0A2R5F950_9PROT|nr:TonB-dependent receptor [Novimethylophilus kurashikiensis]
MLEKAIMSELRNVRKTTFANLVLQFPQSDPDEVQRLLARLILNQDVHSDIHLTSFSMVTEVSAYHEFPPNSS